MGLYGVLVVTEPDDTTGATPAHQAYGTKFDQDVALLFSEIDPVQNASVDQAVRTAGFSDQKVWNGRPGECGDVAVHNVLPAGGQLHAAVLPDQRHLVRPHQPRCLVARGVVCGDAGQRAAAHGQRGSAHACAVGDRLQADAARRRRQQAARQSHGCRAKCCSPRARPTTWRSSRQRQRPAPTTQARMRCMTARSACRQATSATAACRPTSMSQAALGAGRSARARRARH